MVYGKLPRKSRGGNRRMYRKRRGMGVKTVAKIAKQVVERGRETKLLQNDILAYDINPYAYGTTSADTVPFFCLTPNNLVTFPQGLGSLAQGVTQSTRIGNKVEMVKGTLRMQIAANPQDVTYNTNPRPCNVQIFVGYDRLGVNGAIDDSLPAFFQDNSTSHEPTGTNLDLFSKINTDRYVICYKRTLKIGNSEYFGTGSSSTNYYTNNEFKSQRTVNIDFTRRMIKHLRFNDVSGAPSNRGLYCWILVSAPDGSALSTRQIISVSAQIVNQFKDA